MVDEGVDGVLSREGGGANKVTQRIGASAKQVPPLRSLSLRSGRDDRVVTVQRFESARAHDRAENKLTEVAVDFWEFTSL